MAVSIFSASALICGASGCAMATIIAMAQPNEPAGRSRRLRTRHRQIFDGPLHTTIASLEVARREQHGAAPGEDFALLPEQRRLVTQLPGRPTGIPTATAR